MSTLCQVDTEATYCILDKPSVEQWQYYQAGMGTERCLGNFPLRPTLETAHSKGEPYPKQDQRAVRIQTKSSLTQNHFKVQDTKWLTFRKRQNSGATGSSLA